VSVHWRCAALAASLLVPPVELEPADCNGNGVPDERDTLPLFLETATLLPLDDAVLEISGTDMDGDGDLDVAAFTAGAVFFLEGDGGGKFRAARREPLADTPTAALPLHVNGDLHVDLIVAGALEDVRGRGTLSIHEGASGESLRAPRTIAVPPGPEALSAADLDGDGSLDLAVACSRGRGIAILAADGLGSFRDGAFLAVEAAPSLIETRDLDGDGRQDIIAGHPAGALITTFLRRSDGWTDSRVSTERTFETLACLDLDADGDDDLALAGSAAPGGGFLELLENGGRGDLGSVAARSLPESPVFMAAADLDRDVFPDLLTVDPAASSITVRLGPRAQEVLFGKGHATRSAPRRTAPGDIDGDGDLDLLVAEAGGLGVLRHDGAGGFDAARSIAVDRGASHVLAAAVLPGGLQVPLDFDGDGRRDLAVTQGGLDGLCTVVFGGAGGLPEEVTTLGAGPGPKDAAAADLNGDGLPDLAFGSAGRSGTVLPGLSIHLGGRSRSFVSASLLVEGSGVYSVKAGDFDDDGDMDLASAGLDLALWENGGDGSFPRRRQLEVIPARLVAADLDGDGDVDLAAAASPDHELTLVENLGGWDFAPTRALGTRGVGLVAADLDIDGRLDLAAKIRGGVLVLWNAGRGAFEKAFHGASMYAFSAMAPGDLDGDGYPELALASFAEGSIELLRNRGGREFEALPALTLGGTVGSVEAADLDGDGRAEVLAAMPGEGSVFVFQARNPEGVSRDRNENRIPDACEGALFVRGDADADGRVGISDAIRILLHITDGAQRGCEASADTDGDGRILPADASMLLEHLFGGGAAPASPYPRCDVIAPEDPLPCEEHAPCAG
jgi:hypothetical protein